MTLPSHLAGKPALNASGNTQHRIVGFAALRISGFPALTFGAVPSLRLFVLPRLRRGALTVLLLSATALAGCATAEKPPEISYDDCRTGRAGFRPATAGEGGRTAQTPAASRSVEAGGQRRQARA